MSRLLFKILLTILLSSIIFRAPFANSIPVLQVTIETNKQVYNVGETVNVSGNLTLNGSPVSDGLVAVQINDPKGNLHAIRTLSTGQPLTNNWAIEVLQVYLSDNEGLPKTSVKRGTLAYFTIIWRNNDQVPHYARITLNLYYGNIEPFLALIPFSGQVPAQKSQNMTVSAPIPTEAPTGPATVYAAAFPSLPSQGGYAYCPEKSSTFTITTTSSSDQQTMLINPALIEGAYNLSIRIPNKGARLGNYTIFVSSLYDGQQASASITFKVILLGDLNRDGVVDMKDATALLRRYGAVPTDPKWDPEYDLNNDNVIDMKDVTTLLRNYGNYGTY